MSKEGNGKKHFPRFHGEKERTEEEKRLLLKRKRIFAVISFAVTLALIGVLTYNAIKALSLSSNGGSIHELAENFRNLIQDYGNKGIFVALAIQMIQVIISPIPGEVIEVGMGLCFGWFGGAVICLVGVAIASAVVMLFVKKLGTKAVELFVSLDKLNDLRFINDEKKLERFVFLLYLIPGTPKDPLIFFFGLTRISISNFVFISTIARIPSVVSSTIGGKFLLEKNYIGAIIMFAVTGACAVVGLLAYKKILNNLKSRKERKAAKKENHLEKE